MTAATATIALDMPVTSGGMLTSLISIRQPTAADIAAVERAVARRWRREDRELAAAIAAGIDAADLERDKKVARGMVTCALIRAITGLPYSAISHLTKEDQLKINAFLNSNSKT